MTVLKDDIASFERMKGELEATHFNEWVVFHQGHYVDAFADFETAAAAAVDRFDRGPYLIRQVGAPSAVQLTGGMIFTPVHAISSGRI